MTTTNTYTLTALKIKSLSDIETIIKNNNIKYECDINKFMIWIKKDKQTKNKNYVKLLKDLMSSIIIEMKTQQPQNKMTTETKTEQQAPPKETTPKPEPKPTPKPETEEEKEIRLMEEAIKKMKDKKKALEQAKFLKENPPPKPAKEQITDMIKKYKFNEEDTKNFMIQLNKLTEPKGKKNGIEKDPERNEKHKNRDKTSEFLCPYCKFKRMNIKSMNAHLESDKCKRQTDGKEEEKEKIIIDMNKYNSKEEKSETNYMNFLFKF